MPMVERVSSRRDCRHVNAHPVVLEPFDVIGLVIDFDVFDAELGIRKDVRASDGLVCLHRFRAPPRLLACRSLLHQQVLVVEPLDGSLERDSQRCYFEAEIANGLFGAARNMADRALVPLGSESGFLAVDL